MSRLIDADELVKKFKQWMGIEYRMQMFIADVIKTIKGQPTVELQETGKWIPCSERLPENISHVIVQVKEIEKPTIGWYGSMYGWRLTERDFADLKNFTVIAWKPFPEPYRPDKCRGCFGAANNDCERCMDGNR